MEYTYYYNTPLGRMMGASDGLSLTGLWFEGQKYLGAGLEEDHEEKNLPVFEETGRWLDLYFAGKTPDFTPPLVMKGSSFRKAVWDLLLNIPSGETRTYSQLGKIIAKQEGRKTMSAQAVGGAVAHNPISLIIPCHRVLGADGSLTGYAGGLDRKKKLLALEGISYKF